MENSGRSTRQDFDGPDACTIHDDGLKQATRPRDLQFLIGYNAVLVISTNAGSSKATCPAAVEAAAAAAVTNNGHGWQR